MVTLIVVGLALTGIAVFAVAVARAIFRVIETL